MQAATHHPSHRTQSGAVMAMTALYAPAPPTARPAPEGESIVAQHITGLWRAHPDRQAYPWHWTAIADQCHGAYYLALRLEEFDAADGYWHAGQQAGARAELARAGYDALMAA